VEPLTILPFLAVAINPDCVSALLIVPLLLVVYPRILAGRSVGRLPAKACCCDPAFPPSEPGRLS